MINKDTQLCMSLSGRPGNFGTTFHNYLYQRLGLNLSIKPLLLRILKAPSKASVHLAFEDVPFRCLLKKAACHF